MKSSTNAGAELWDGDPRLELPCAQPFHVQEVSTGEVLNIPCNTRFSEKCPRCAASREYAEKRILRDGMQVDPWRITNRLDFEPAAAFVTLTLPSVGRIKPQSGSPAYPDQYGYFRQIVHTFLEPALLRSWTEKYRRKTRRWTDAGFEASLRGSREIQQRGSGHYHLHALLALRDNSQWDGKTYPIAQSEFLEMLKDMGDVTAEVPQQLQDHAKSNLVKRRRDQLLLPKPTKHTLAVPKKIRLGNQVDHRPVNLVSSPKVDPESVERSISYSAKAISYQTKHLGGTPSDQMVKENDTHLYRLSREAFALLADFKTTSTVEGWLQRWVSNLTKHLRETRHRFHDRRPGVVALLAQYKQALDALRYTGVQAWEFLDDVAPSDIPQGKGRGWVDPLGTLLGEGRDKKSAKRLLHKFEHLGLNVTLAEDDPYSIPQLSRERIGRMIRHQLGMRADIVPVDHTRMLVKWLIVVLRRIITWHGHTGTAIYSSNWPTSLKSVREAQKTWAVFQAMIQGKAPCSRLGATYVPMHEPIRWVDTLPQPPPF